VSLLGGGGVERGGKIPDPRNGIKPKKSQGLWDITGSAQKAYSGGTKFEQRI